MYREQNPPYLSNSKAKTKTNCILTRLSKFGLASHITNIFSKYSTQFTHQQALKESRRLQKLINFELLWMRIRCLWVIDEIVFTNVHIHHIDKYTNTNIPLREDWYFWLDMIFFHLRSLIVNVHLRYQVIDGTW